MPDVPEPLTLWRAYVPEWAHAPLAGEGAARFGGRWDAKGRPALYAACELSTAWAEHNQGFIQHPATIVQLLLTGARLTDARDASLLARYDAERAIHRCEWRAILEAGGMPETHVLTRRLAADGFDGVVYPSFMSPGGSCVALWRWNALDAPVLSVIDPEGRFPATAASWTR